MTFRKIDISFPLLLSFLVFSMLLNCMGVIILQLSHQKISYNGLGLLEFFKDLPIALVSIYSVNFIKKFSSKTSLIFSLLVVAVCCVCLPFLEVFWFFKVWFAIIGISFAVAKISVFSILKFTITEPKRFTEIMSRVEASFMIGVFFVNTGFAWLLASTWSEFWKFGFWFIALIAAFTAFIISKYEITEKHEVENKAERFGLKDIFKTQTLYFFLIVFLIVFIENSFNSWLPVFYRNYLQTNSFFALQSAAFLALFSFGGRMITSKIISKVNWFTYIVSCLCIILAILVFTQINIIYFSQNLGITAYIFPLIGLFSSPLYPVFNSQLLIRNRAENTSRIVSVIVVFSSLGSSFGSFLMSVLFQQNLGQFYAIVLIILLLIILFLAFLILRQYKSK